LAQVAVSIIKALEIEKGSQNKEFKQLLFDAFKIITQSLKTRPFKKIFKEGNTTHIQTPFTTFSSQII
jgi:hypothetical protein